MNCITKGLLETLAQITAESAAIEEMILRGDLTAPPADDVVRRYTVFAGYTCAPLRVAAGPLPPGFEPILPPNMPLPEGVTPESSVYLAITTAAAELCRRADQLVTAVAEKDALVLTRTLFALNTSRLFLASAWKWLEESPTPATTPQEQPQPATAETARFLGRRVGLA